MQRYRTVPMLLVLSLGCRSAAVTTMRPAPDDGLGAVLHTLLFDSLVGAGRRPGELYVAADSASAIQLRSAGIPVAPHADGSGLTCPGSTDASGEPTTGMVGYTVRIRRTSEASGVLQLEMGVSCSFVFQGKARRFAQGGAWELRRVNERWQIVRALGLWIT